MPGQHWIEEHPEYGHVAGCGFCDPLRPQFDLYGTNFEEADDALTAHLCALHSGGDMPDPQEARQGHARLVADEEHTVERER